MTTVQSTRKRSQRRDRTATGRTEHVRSGCTSTLEERPAQRRALHRTDASSPRLRIRRAVPRRRQVGARPNTAATLTADRHRRTIALSHLRTHCRSVAQSHRRHFSHLRGAPGTPGTVTVRQSVVSIADVFGRAPPGYARRKSRSADALSNPPRVVPNSNAANVACTVIANSTGMDHADRTRVEESLRSISGDLCRPAPRVGARPNTSATLTADRHVAPSHFRTFGRTVAPSHGRTVGTSATLSTRYRHLRHSRHLR